MRVINIKAGEQYTVYCGRDYGRHKSVGLGNPFVVGKHGTRDECCRLFTELLFGYTDEVYKLLNESLEQTNARSQALQDAVLNLPSDAVLGCWCKPARCHCDSIVEYWGMMRSSENWTG